MGPTSRVLERGGAVARIQRQADGLDDQMGTRKVTAQELLREPLDRTYRALAPQVGRKTRLVRPSLGLTRRSLHEDAIKAGERFAIEFRAGGGSGEAAGWGDGRSTGDFGVHGRR